MKPLLPPPRPLTPTPLPLGAKGFALRGFDIRVLKYGGLMFSQGVGVLLIPVPFYSLH